MKARRGWEKDCFQEAQMWEILQAHVLGKVKVTIQQLRGVWQLSGDWASLGRAVLGQTNPKGEQMSCV